MAVDQSYAVVTAVDEHAAPQPRWIPTRRPTGAARLLQGPGWRALRLALDSLLLALAGATALLQTPGADGDGGWFALLLAPLTLILLTAGGQYRARLHVTAFDGVGRVIATTSLAAGTLITASALGTPHLDPHVLIAQAWGLACAFLVVGRVATNVAQRRMRATRLVAAPALIVGAGQIGARMEQRLASEPELGLQPIGYLDADPPPAEDVPLRSAPVLGSPQDLGRVAEQTGARHVVIGFTRDPDSALFELVRECEDRGLHVSVVPRMFEFVSVHHELEHLGPLPLFSFEAVDPKSAQFAVKHAFDRVVAAIALAALAPVMLAIAAAVRLNSRGPALFHQRRIGRDGRDFDLLKFRSMRMPDEPSDAPTPLLPADTAPGGVEGLDRRTRVGSFLRRTSLDELPQLINVLRGEMSLVGPRPERPEFVEMFERRVRRYEERHRVKSGITGWAQINGLRGRTSLSDRVEHDNHYIVNWSLALDLRILLLTVGALLTRGEDE